MTLILPEKKHSIAGDLRRLIGSEKVRDDAPALTAYAVDASIYKIVPKAIVLAESEEDIQRVVDYAVRSGVPLTPRAAGTNLTGSAIGSGIILDVSRLNRILEINREEQWARVQPGIVLAELNKRLARDGVMFGPDPSSGDMCKLGGMVANNSAGPHTLRYGSVKDNVQALRVYLQTGQWLDARSYAVDDSRLNEIRALYPAVGNVLNMVRTHGELIRSKRPTVSKNSCGYNLFGLLDGLDRNVCDLPKLFVGSEGTLGVMSEATIRLVPRPKATTTALIHFRTLDEVGDAVFKLLSLSPSALEVMDGNTLNLIGRSQHGIPADAEATLIAEFDETEESSTHIDYGHDIGSSVAPFASQPIRFWRSLMSSVSTYGKRARRCTPRSTAMATGRSRSIMWTMSLCGRSALVNWSDTWKGFSNTSGCPSPSLAILETEMPTSCRCWTSMTGRILRAWWKGIMRSTRRS
jgi:FAD/FMN-containing dehydrogenases